LHVNADAPAISGVALEALVHEYRDVMAKIKRLMRLYPEQALGAMVHCPPLALDDLADRAKVEAWIKILAERIAERRDNRDVAQFDITVIEDTERKLFLPHIAVMAHGVGTNYRLSHDFFKSGEYAAIVKLGSQINNLMEEGGYVRRGERTQPVKQFSEALEWLMAQAERGLNIQRYKGLGEMNPEQLWETTMDASVRRMLRVTIDDAIAADQIFTCLMGDAVEPRREFIEQNALKVANLDI
jgi:DNA gyrase subunit B